jgi:hypothetical protein
MAGISVDEINRSIEAENARWLAADHPLLRLEEPERKRRLGVVIDEGQLAKHRGAPKPDLDRIIADYALRRATGRPIDEPPFSGGHRNDPPGGSAGPGPAGRGPVATVAAPVKADPRTGLIAAVNAVSALRAQPFDLTRLFPFPFWWLFVVDWRNRWGQSFVTPVTDQGGCGSCVSFGTIATLESMALIEHNLTTDLSEAELLFCGGGSCGGWWPDSAVNYLTTRGVAQESCFPYVPMNQPCRTCGRRDGEAMTVKQHLTINDVTQRKDYLFFVGPVMCVFAVYDDFFGYRSGVYSHVSGGLAGYHCVEVIGYDDFEGCWICKNSWGAAWGDSGFFKIAYGECDIDTSFPFWGIYDVDWYA